MKNWKTTLCGAVAAVSLALGSGCGLPEPWPKVLGLLCAAALGALGYHSSDCATCPGNKARLAALSACLLLVGAACGCAVSGFGLAVSSPAFGALQVTVGGGAVGNRALTNFPPLAQPVLPGLAVKAQ